MGSLQCMPASINLCGPGGCLGSERCMVIRGSPICTVSVGGTTSSISAQAPPAQGDRWSIAVDLKRGSYVVTIEAWLNSSQGMLDLYLDGVRITSAQGIDLSALAGETREYTQALPVIRVGWTGTHRLVGEVSRTRSTAADASDRHWMCLKSLKIQHV